MKSQETGCILRTSLVVQWLRLCASTAGDAGLILVEELRSRMPEGAAKKTKQKGNWMYSLTHSFLRTLSELLCYPPNCWEDLSEQNRSDESFTLQWEEGEREEKKKNINTPASLLLLECIRYSAVLRSLDSQFSVPKMYFHRYAHH